MISCTQGLWLRACHGCSHGLAQLGTAWHRLQMAQLGMVWHGMAQHGLVQLSLARHSMARLGTAQLSMAQHGTARHGSAHLNMAQLGMARHVLATALSAVGGAELPAAPCTPALLLLPLGGQELEDPYPHQAAMGLSPPAPSPSQGTQQMLLKEELPSCFQFRFTFDRAKCAISAPRLSQTHPLGTRSNPLGWG